MKKTKPLKIGQEILANKIHYIRGQKVMLDKDLAELYGVQSKVLNQAVKRNVERFPEDFMIQLTVEEFNSLRSQIVTLKQGKHSKYLPFAFTEQGVAMLSSVLRSKQAISVNIQIMRVFTKMREMISANKEIVIKLEQLENKFGSHDEQIRAIFGYLKKLLNPSKSLRRKAIGYKIRK